MTAVFGSGMRIMSDSWISWKPRIDEPSNPKPFVEHVLGQLVRRRREVLHQSRQVTEPEVDDLHALVPGQARTSSGVRSCTAASFAMRTGAS